MENDSTFRQRSNRDRQRLVKAAKSEKAGNIPLQQRYQRGPIGRSRQHLAAEWLHGRPKVRPANCAAATAGLQGDAVQLESSESARSTAKGQVVGDLWRPATQ